MGNQDTGNPMPTIELSPDLRPLTERTTDTWTWTAFYRDGTVLEEYGSDGDHGFGEIDLRRLWQFQASHVDGSGRAYGVTIDPDKGQRPIFFRRRASDSTQGQPGYTIMTCVGRQETVWASSRCRRCGAVQTAPCVPECPVRGTRGRNVSVYVFFDDNGRVLIADTPNPPG